MSRRVSNSKRKLKTLRLDGWIALFMVVGSAGLAVGPSGCGITPEREHQDRDAGAGGAGGVTGGQGGGAGGAGGYPMGGSPAGGEGGNVGGGGGQIYPDAGVGGFGGEPMGGEPMGGEPVGGGVGGGGGEGGMGGGIILDCVDACDLLASCSLGSEACPNIYDEASRDALYDGCLPTCEANPALRALVNADDCEGTIATIRGVSPDYDQACGEPADGGLPDMDILDGGLSDAEPGDLGLEDFGVEDAGVGDAEPLDMSLEDADLDQDAGMMLDDDAGP